MVVVLIIDGRHAGMEDIGLKAMLHALHGHIAKEIKGQTEYPPGGFSA